MSQQAHEKIWQQIKSQLDSNPELGFENVIFSIQQSADESMIHGDKTEKMVAYGIWTSAEVLKQAWEHFKEKQ